MMGWAIKWVLSMLTRVTSEKSWQFLQCDRRFQLIFNTFWNINLLYVLTLQLIYNIFCYIYSQFFFFFIVHQAFTSEMLNIFKNFTFKLWVIVVFVINVENNTPIRHCSFFFVCLFLDFLVQHLFASSLASSQKFIRSNLLISL